MAEVGEGRIRTSVEQMGGPKVRALVRQETPRKQKGSPLRRRQKLHLSHSSYLAPVSQGAYITLVRSSAAATDYWVVSDDKFTVIRPAHDSHGTRPP